MKKKHFIYFLLFLSAQFVYSQVESSYYPEGNARSLSQKIDKNYKAEKLITMPAFNVKALIEEDKKNAESVDPKPYRFGKAFDTDINIDVASEGEETKEGRIWSTEFHSKGAISMNFVLSNLQLTDGAELYLYNDTGTMIYGPVTSEQNKTKGVFLTDVIFGDHVTMYVKEPSDSERSSKFTIKRVVHGYRGPDIQKAWGTPGASEFCNNDLACFSAWINAGNSVALILLTSGTEWCSGCLVNSTDNSLRPYFLSAFHCADTNFNGTLSTTEKNNAGDWLFKFGYRRTGCSTSNGIFNFIMSNGATFRAGWNTTDFLLLELDRLAYNGSHTYAGWDRGANAPSSGAGIHHPAGDIKKISIEINTFQTSSWNGTNSNWLVNFDDGVVQHVSSGSPLFNQNQRVVGQLQGNQNYNPSLSYCRQTRGEYGKFNLSWTGGGTNSTRLSNWLDPCGTGAQTTNAITNPYMSNPGTIGCTERPVTIYDLPAGATLSWSSSSNLTRTTSQGVNPAKFKARGSGSAWIRAVVTTSTSCASSYTIQRTVTANGGNSSISLSAYNGNGWLSANASGASGPYTWIIYGNGGSNQVTTTSPNLTYNIGCGGGFLQVQGTNSCGNSIYGSQSIPGCSGGGIGFYRMEVYPNPTSDKLNLVQISSSENSKIGDNTSIQLESAILYDFAGTAVKSIRINKTSDRIQLDVSDLKAGHYFLKIRGKEIDETHKIIIN
ncbi:T9SS type A sorting domain-containing protein [uncultured Kordia sp.]|uniref:T9SS type A sorting domain-containing protein n=1 Tax=uncultured Kordia sp. TaxID=507699 RepID=UPI00262AD801|nr:T9SS type A sorting domain-containing protein [uncultured Kordia sp.]